MGVFGYPQKYCLDNLHDAIVEILDDQVEKEHWLRIVDKYIQRNRKRAARNKDRSITINTPLKDYFDF